MKSFRWAVVGLVFLATMINYIDRTALSYAIIPLEKTFHLSNTDFGMAASAFGLGYLIMTVVGGVMVDRFGAHKIWSLFALFWSLSCALIGVAAGFVWILLFRLLLGVSEGPAFPALTRVSADWLPLRERARALGIGLAAVPFASVLGAPLISNLIELTGWRSMFIILGLTGLVWCVVWFIVFRDRPKDCRFVSRQEQIYIRSENQTPASRTKKTSWRFILFNPALLANNFAFFSFGYLLFFSITWLPGYLEQTYHMAIRTVGWFLVMPWATATVTILLGGVLSDWLMARTGSIRIARSHLIWICQSVSALCFLPLIFTHSLTVVAITISLGVGIGLMPNAAFYAINTDLAYDRAATSLGVMDCAFALAGILAPVVTGWLATVTGNFSAAIGLMVVLTFGSAVGVFVWQKDFHLR